MMYCTQQDLIDRGWEKELTQVTDKDRLNEMNAVAVEQAIEDASADIDSYLQGRYSLPLSVTVPNLNRIACDITRFYLHDKVAPEQVKRRYEVAMRWLEQVAKGAIKLGIENVAEATVIGNEAVMTSDGNRFARGF